MNSDNVYMKVLRIGAGIAAVMLWSVSVQFSVKGFSITLPEMEWIGWTLAISVTILQLIFNKGVYNNPTLFLAGILAYTYGVITNIVGIMRAQEILDTLLISVSEEPGRVVPKAIMAIVLALVIEIVPEALLLWAIFLDKAKVGDFVSSVLQGTYLSKKKLKSVRNNVQNNVQNMSKSTVHGQDRTDRGRDRTNPGQWTNFVQDGTKPGQSPSSDEGRVISYCLRHKRQHGSLPAVRKVEHDTGIPKTKVAEIMKPLRVQ